MNINISDHRKKIIVVYLLLIAAAIWSASQLKVNYLFENFFPKNDSDYIAYKEFRTHFTNDDRFVQVAFTLPDGIFNPESLEKIGSIESTLDQYEDIVDLKSLNRLRFPVKTPLGWISTPVLRSNPETLEEDSIAIMNNDLLRTNLISEDGLYYSMNLKLADSTSDLQNKEIILFIENTLESFEVSKYHLGGFTNTQVNYVRLLEGEFPMAAATSAISMCLILLLLYRSYTNALLPTLTVIISLVVFFGYLGLIGRDLNITSTLFITIMTIVAVSDIVHLQTYYHKYLSKGKGRREAIQMALNDTFINLFLTSITTAIGFLTFLSSSIPHIQTFGVDAGVGVMVAFVVTVTLGPILLYYYPPSEKRLAKERSEKLWDRLLHGVYLQGKKNPYLTYGVTALILVISIIGIQRIQSNQYLAGNFDDDTQIKKDFNFFEAQFGGVRALEMHLNPQPGYKITDVEILQSLDSLEKFLIQNPLISAPLSPASWIKGQNMAVSGAREAAYKIPDNQEAIDYLMTNDRNNQRLTVISEEADAGRLIAKMKDIGSLKAEELTEEIETWAVENMDPNVIQLTMTGSALLIDKNNENVLTEMLYSLGLAFLCISILMAILFKRTKMILISIIPNLVPLVAVAGVMGWIGIPLNAATSLIFTIGFVIAIDDTIHFLTRFKREYAGKKSLELSIKNTLGHTGKAILHTTIILVVVYAASIFSQFTEISQHAILVAATLVFAILADFYLLPTLLRQAAKKKDLF